MHSEYNLRSEITILEEPVSAGGGCRRQEGKGGNMKHRLGMTIVILHTSAFVNIALALLLVAVGGTDTETAELFGPLPVGFIAALCVVFAAGVEITVWGLKQRKFWAWVTGLGLCAIYSLSILFPLGMLGLWGLLADGSRREFGIGVNGPAMASAGPKSRA